MAHFNSRTVYQIFHPSIEGLAFLHPDYRLLNHYDEKRYENLLYRILPSLGVGFKKSILVEDLRNTYISIGQGLKSCDYDVGLHLSVRGIFDHLGVKYVSD